MRGAYSQQRAGLSSSSTSMSRRPRNGNMFPGFQIKNKPYLQKNKTHIRRNVQSTECPKIYGKSVLHLLKYTKNTVQICSTTCRNQGQRLDPPLFLPGLGLHSGYTEYKTYKTKFVYKIIYFFVFNNFLEVSEIHKKCCTFLSSDQDKQGCTMKMLSYQLDIQGGGPIKP